MIHVHHASFIMKENKVKNCRLLGQKLKNKDVQAERPNLTTFCPLCFKTDLVWIKSGLFINLEVEI